MHSETAIDLCYSSVAAHQYLGEAAQFLRNQGTNPLAMGEWAITVQMSGAPSLFPPILLHRPLFILLSFGIVWSFRRAEKFCFCIKCNLWVNIIVWSLFAASNGNRAFIQSSTTWVGCSRYVEAYPCSNESNKRWRCRFYTVSDSYANSTCIFQSWGHQESIIFLSKKVKDEELWSG